jgi:hypothetical protein
VSEFRSVWSDPPDWSDSGTIELREKDGAVTTAEMYIDAAFNGEDEYPVPVVTKDGQHLSFFNYEEWRLTDGSAAPSL